MNLTGLPATLFPARLLASGGWGEVTATQMLMLAAAIAGLTIVMLSTRRRIRKSRRTPRIDARRRYEQIKGETKAAHDIEQVMVELEALSRQIHGRIDTKLVRLEVTIRDADRRIAELAKATRAATAGSGLEITLDREEPRDHAADGPETGDSEQATVFRLADSGMSPHKIAQEVGKLTGEIELLLALRKTRNEVNQASGNLAVARPASKN
jgi:hypothetical protein